MKIICIITALPQDLSMACLNSIFTQTVPIDIVVLAFKRVDGGNLVERVSWVLNDALRHLRIEDFDYILRLSGDVILPRNFLESNLKDNPDLCGKTGQAQLIKVQPFIKHCGGKVHPQSDDTFLNLKFNLLKLKVQKCTVAPWFTRPNGATHGLKYFYERGFHLYKLGYEPLHVCADLLFDIRDDVRNLICFFTYAISWLKHEERSDFGQCVWKYQIMRLRNHIKL